MNTGAILELLKKWQEGFFWKTYRDYFFGEWTIPWLPDDL